MPGTPLTPAWISDRCGALEAQGFEFFVVATASNLAQFDMAPFGIPLKPVPFLGPNPHGWDTNTFVRLFHSLDTLVFAGRDLTMPNWVLVDHALLSSGLVIVACRQDRFDEIGRAFDLTPDERFTLSSLKAEAADRDFDGPIPVASYIAAPTADPGRRVGWSLCSIVPRSGLAFVVKGLALAAYRTRFLSGTTQYDNVALRVHTKFGPARMRAAVVDIHTAAHTLAYETNLQHWLTDAGSAEEVPEPTWLVSATDSDRHAELQTMIDAQSHTLTILPPGVIVREDGRFVPILATDYVDPDAPIS